MSRRTLAILAAGTVGAFVLWPASPIPSSPKTSNPFVTQGSTNIGNRWSAGGGTDTHTPGYATPRGKQDDVSLRQTTPSGPASDEFQQKQAAQRPGQPGVFDKAWNEAHYGTAKGK